MSNLVRRRGNLDMVDTAVGVGVGIIAAVFILKILGGVFSLIFLAVKIAIIAVLAVVVMKIVGAFRHSDR